MRTAFVQRLRARWWLVRHHGEELNRRADIETYLLMCASGKRPLPTTDACRKLALRLGTPKAHWSEYVKEKLP